jgi:hypothetical protein
LATLAIWRWVEQEKMRKQQARSCKLLYVEPVNEKERVKKRNLLLLRMLKINYLF